MGTVGKGRGATDVRDRVARSESIDTTMTNATSWHDIWHHKTC